MIPVSPQSSPEIFTKQPPTQEAAQNVNKTKANQTAEHLSTNKIVPGVVSEVNQITGGSKSQLIEQLKAIGETPKSLFEIIAKSYKFDEPIKFITDKRLLLGQRLALSVGVSESTTRKQPILHSFTLLNQPSSTSAEQTLAPSLVRGLLPISLSPKLLTDILYALDKNQKAFISSNLAPLKQLGSMVRKEISTHLNFSQNPNDSEGKVRRVHTTPNASDISSNSMIKTSNARLSPLVNSPQQIEELHLDLKKMITQFPVAQTKLLKQSLIISSLKTIPADILDRLNHQVRLSEPEHGALLKPTLLAKQLTLPPNNTPWLVTLHQHLMTNWKSYRIANSQLLHKDLSELRSNIPHSIPSINLGGNPVLNPTSWLDNILSVLVRATVGSISRNQLHFIQSQTEHVEDHNKKLLYMDIPIQLDNEFDQVTLAIEQRTKNQKHKKEGILWLVHLGFSLKKLGDIFIELALHDHNRVKLHLWSPNSDTLQRINEQRKILINHFKRNGMQLNQFRTHMGTRKVSNTSCQSKLINLET